MGMNIPYHAPPRASFLQKLGPGGAATLGLAILTALGFAGLPWAFRFRQVLSGVHGDELAFADVVLVLGRRLEQDQPTQVFEARLAHAEALWRRGFAPRIFLAGGTTGNARRSEAEAGRDWLVARGVPGSALFLEDRSQHTLENLFNVRADMRTAGWQTVLMVTDPLHLARARATAQGLDLDVRCSAAQESPPTHGSFAWWRRAALEAFLLHWYHTGMAYSRLVQSKRQLERVT